VIAFVLGLFFAGIAGGCSRTSSYLNPNPFTFIKSTR
jgi:hypothetical protein